MITAITNGKTADISAASPTTTPDVPAYGASEHYTGDKGQEYFAWQSAGGAFGALINAHKFRHLVKPSDVVLDFGCGGGFLLNALHCAKRIGVEINPIARAHAQSLGIECYADAADVPDGVADVVLSDHALEHVPFPIDALHTLSSKMKPTGTLSICVPIDNWRRQRVYDPKDRNHHLHTWTPQLLGNTLFEAGYEIHDIYARTFAWPGRWTVATYHRLPYWMFKAICFGYGTLTAKGWEILAVATRAGSGTRRP